MTWPQIAMIALMASAFGMNVALHGQPRTGEWSMFWSAFGIGLHAWILIAGGFFK